jgi:hypothetical protein
MSYVTAEKLYKNVVYKLYFWPDTACVIKLRIRWTKHVESTYKEMIRTVVACYISCEEAIWEIQL